MLFEALANELIIQIYLSLHSIADVLALSQTCRHFHSILASSSRLPIFASAAESEFGPLRDSIQLITHNASQPAHIPRSVPMSFALLRQILLFGRVANKWADIYPLKKWKIDYANRRLLTNSERYRVRRAIYRLWLYSRAFHNRKYPRTTRLLPIAIKQRSDLLRNWSTVELAEMKDVHIVLRDVLQNHVCPSNGTIQREFRKRFPDSDHQLLFNIHLNYPPPPPPPSSSSLAAGAAYPSLSSPNASMSTAAAKYAYSAHHDPGSEGWGDEILHYYVVEDMLKLNPGQILWLRENAPLKVQVKMFLKEVVGVGRPDLWSMAEESARGGPHNHGGGGWSLGGGDWFEDNGETFGQTMQWILCERGEDPEEIMEAVDACDLGVVVVEEH